MPAAAEPAPRAVEIARTTAIPRCTAFVDAEGGGAGTAQSPHRTIAAAVAAAASGAVICVAEGTYAEQLRPETKFFTLAGGFKRGTGFTLRDSATYVSKAQGNGSGSFFFVNDPGPTTGQLTAIDGFEITGYARAIVREFYEPQRFDITNNYIHDNVCKDLKLVGAGFALDNVTGTIKGNVIARNACGRGGAGFLNDGTNKNSVSIENNLIDANAGTEPDASHGGGLYVGANKLRIVGNLITNNTVTQWGAGIWIGAYAEGGQFVTATLAWNVYRGNRAGNKGGGFFCDEGATCISDHEVYEGNCGANIYLDSGGEKSRTIATFDHLTNVGALDADCKTPGPGAIIEAGNNKTDAYAFTNAVFKGNAMGRDFVTGCSEECKQSNVKVSVTHSMVQTDYYDGGIKVAFGEGIVPPSKQAAAPDTAAPKEIEAVAATPTPEPTPTQVTGRKPIESMPSQLAEGRDAAAADDQTSAKDAFAAAKDLGTAEAWNAFLTNYPTGFYADLARAYLKKLGVPLPAPAAEVAAPPKPAAAAVVPPALPPALAAPAPANPAAPAPTVAPGAPAAQDFRGGSDLAPTNPAAPAVARGATYMGFPERFNRYYTDPTWRPTKTLYVSPDGGGDGTTRDTPMPVKAALAAAGPGTGIYFVRGAYTGGYELEKANSGSYDDPIVLYGERSEDGSIGVKIDCNSGSRRACINLEGADYVAVDGFEFIGGRHGGRAIGLGYPASQHSRGATFINCIGHDQDDDPFLSGQADWAIWERNIAYGAKKGDGHGIYLSNAGDWNIVRFNETFDNASSDFQINASPNSTCKEEGIAFDDPRCDAYAGTGDGGQGASDYFLVDSNYFHHGKAQGPNFTSVRRSVIRNNIFGIYARHGTSFWQETDNPKLGASENRIVNNLFVTTGRPAVQFIVNSTRNVFVGNVLLGVSIAGEGATANPSAVLMEVDDTTAANLFIGNFYIGGKLEGRSPSAQELVRPDFSANWFAKFPLALNHDPNDFAPAPGAPFLNAAPLSTDAPADRNGTPRQDRVDPGPIEVP